MIESNDVEHHLYVIRVYQRKNNDLWFVTVCKDAIQVFVSPDKETKQSAIGCATDYLLNNMPMEKGITGLYD